MKKFLSLIVTTVLTVVVFLTPAISKLFEPVNHVLAVVLIELALIFIAFFLGCFSKSNFKFLYTVAAGLVFVLSGLILYRDFCKLSVIRDYGFIILITTLVAVLLGSMIRQVIVAIIKAIRKKKKAE